MSGEKNLDKLMRDMTPVLSDKNYVFVSVSFDHSIENISYLMLFREKEGITLIVDADEAQRHNLTALFECRMITLSVHSSLEAVGFMARIANLLAADGISVNPVSGAYHDHLFIPTKDAERAMVILQNHSTDLTASKEAP
jgi:hypothetical protein